MYKSCQRSVARQDFPCNPDKDSSSNTDESREDTYCELAVKDEEQDPLHKKNIHAGGDLDLDLDLEAIKSNILDLIDRVMSKKLTTTPGQQKVYKNSRIVYFLECIHFHYLSECRIESGINGTRIFNRNNTCTARRILRIIRRRSVESSRNTG